MRNYLQKGENINIPAPADRVSGAPILVGSQLGITAWAAKTCSDLNLGTVGVSTLPKVALNIAIGDGLHFRGSNRVGQHSAGKTLFGMAVTATVNPSGTVDARLNGIL
ncbi:DUF2190 family protein [Devosia naphthalenivorans]|uniref:DUF2190 family protein n=1 Tax=Devosia naphthalenivorans TaxID=2082392 RepID=UPI0013B0661C|nr:DUF2190 family protein [Devosia naphthalenivorans]